MPFKKIPRTRKNSQPVLCMVTLPMRAQIERLARQRRISLSEFGRIALTEFVERQIEPKPEISEA